MKTASILICASLALTGCHNYQSSVQAQQNILNGETDCIQQKESGVISTELELAQCKGSIFFTEMAKSNYPFPRLVTERLQAEYEIARQLDAKKISQDKANALREAANLAMAEKEGLQYQQKMQQSNVQSQAGMNALATWALVNAATQPRQPINYQTTCTETGIFTNCNTRGW